MGALFRQKDFNLIFVKLKMVLLLDELLFDKLITEYDQLPIKETQLEEPNMVTFNFYISFIGDVGGIPDISVGSLADLKTRTDLLEPYTFYILIVDENIQIEDLQGIKFLYAVIWGKAIDHNGFGSGLYEYHSNYNNIIAKSAAKLYIDNIEQLEYKKFITDGIIRVILDGKIILGGTVFYDEPIYRLKTFNLDMVLFSDLLDVSIDTLTANQDNIAISDEIGIMVEEYEEFVFWLMSKFI